MVIIREFKNLFESLAKMFVQNICLFEMFLQDICWKRLFDTCLLKNKSLEKSLKQIFLTRIWVPWIKMFVFWAIFELKFRLLNSWMSKSLEKTSQTNVSNKRLEQMSWTNVSNKCLALVWNNLPLEILDPSLWNLDFGILRISLACSLIFSRLISPILAINLP